jgi:hypothetical protein
MLEAEDLAALRIDAGHDVLDRAVLARRVHRLKNQQQRVAVVGVKQPLPPAHFLDPGGLDRGTVKATDDFSARRAISCLTAAFETAKRSQP